MKNKFEFNENTISATLIDELYLWIAFEGVDSVSTIYKSSIFNPNTVYWNIDVVGDEITSLWQDTLYIYGSLDDTTNIGVKFLKTSPNGFSYYVKQSGINEEAVDVIVDATYVYFLTPGTISGENAKICKYNKTSLAFVETIDLTTVFNANKIDIDRSGNLWVLTATNPVILTKVYYSGGWSYTSYTLS